MEDLKNTTLDIEKTTLDIKQIQEIIPHRYPFLFVDKVEELEPGIRAVGYKNITMNEYFFQGHFPEEPILPGVIIIEALAQVGAVALLSMESYKGKIAYFGGINKAKFRKKVVPGDVLKLDVEIIKMKGPVGIGLGIASVNGVKVAQAEITFAVGI
jgi:3-hydroxyacyl-[acyl-carrier-protein] dehydratase